MDIAITIGGVDKTSLIEWPSFTIEDNANEQPDFCNFRIKVHSGQTYKPETGDEVIVTDDGTRIFAGEILSVENTFSGDIIYYDCECKDYTLYLDRKNVIESYEEQTVDDIIDDLVSDYLSGFTVTNVDCDIEITKIIFNGQSLTKCLNDLAKLTNYIWWVDYNKDIHFIAKNSSSAPFNIADDSNYILGDSLKLVNDISQLRNVVRVRGGEKVATNNRSKTHTGDGTATTFSTDYKFAEKPSVSVAGSPVTVGVENLETSGYTCYWDYNQKYIRFDTAPTSGQAVVITGKPLIPIIVEVEDLGSISRLKSGSFDGRCEFYKVDKSLKSSEDAQLYASAQLESYANGIREGSFRTYESGLKSGQTISINLTDIGVADSFIIQRVSLILLTPTKGEWVVELATTKTMGIIKFLQDKLLSDDNIELNENEVIERYYKDNQTIQVTESVELLEKKDDHQDVQVTESIEKDPFGAGVLPDFVWCPYTPTGNSDPKRELYWDKGLWE